jgi:hypothetical protein
MRTVLAATAVGLIAGGGVVFSLAGQSAGQTSVAERTLVRPIPPVSTSVSAPQAAQLNPRPLHQRESTEVSLDEGQVDGSATNELSANAPARPGSRGGFRQSTHVTKDRFKNCCCAITRRPETLNSGRAKRTTQGSYKLIAASAAFTGASSCPNMVDRFFAGVTAAFEHVWPPQS